MLQFKASIGSRSSKAQSGGPPGEADLLMINPQRREEIIRVSGWKELIPGTLNLQVAEEIVHRLLLHLPLFCEKGDNVNYPPQFSYIPRKRIGYLYYRAIIKKGEKSAEVLIRRACNPLKDRLEAFSDIKLRDELSLSDGDTVECTIID